MFWLPAVLLFYIPSGIVVAHLVKEMPLEGGLYQWAKLRFSPLIGFLVAMNIWLYNILIICKVGVIVTDNAAYAFGPSGAWLSTSKPAIILISLAAICGLMLLAWRGLGVGKWVNNFGGLAIVMLFVAMIVVAIPALVPWRLRNCAGDRPTFPDRARAVAPQPQPAGKNGIWRLRWL